MEPRRIGEDVTKVTRQDANIKVQRQQRYKQIIECLREHHQLTAKECAVIMQRKGYIPTTERNYTAPRLTELSEIGVVEPVGKKRCDYTGKLVAVYALREVPERDERRPYEWNNSLQGRDGTQLSLFRNVCCQSD